MLFPFDIISLGLTDEKRILQIINIGADGFIADRHTITAEGVGQLCGICKRSNCRSQDVQQRRHNIVSAQIMPVFNVLQVQLPAEGCQVSGFQFVCFPAENQRQTTIGVIIHPCVIFISGVCSDVLCKGKRIYTHLVPPAPELRQNVSGQEL